MARSLRGRSAVAVSVTVEHLELNSVEGRR
jgi:hypothetical protein